MTSTKYPFATEALLEELCMSPNRHVTMLIGPHGVGKTSVVRNIAKKHGLSIVIRSAPTMDTDVDLAGIPELVDGPNGKTLELHLSKAFCEADVIFIDEVTCGKPAVLNALLEMLASGTLNGRELRACWIVVAGNPWGADGYDTYKPSDAFLDRLDTCFTMPTVPDVDLIARNLLSRHPTFDPSVVTELVEATAKTLTSPNFASHMTNEGGFDYFSPRRVEKITDLALTFPQNLAVVTAGFPEGLSEAMLPLVGDINDPKSLLGKLQSILHPRNDQHSRPLTGVITTLGQSRKGSAPKYMTYVSSPEVSTLRAEYNNATEDRQDDILQSCIKAFTRVSGVDPSKSCLVPLTEGARRVIGRGATGTKQLDKFEKMLADSNLNSDNACDNIVSYLILLEFLLDKDAFLNKFSSGDALLKAVNDFLKVLSNEHSWIAPATMRLEIQVEDKADEDAVRQASFVPGIATIIASFVQRLFHATQNHAKPTAYDENIQSGLSQMLLEMDMATAFGPHLSKLTKALNEEVPLIEGRFQEDYVNVGYGNYPNTFLSPNIVVNIIEDVRLNNIR